MGHTPSCLGEDGGPGCRISSQLTQVHFGLRCRKFNSIVAQQHGPMEGATVALRFFFSPGGSVYRCHRFDLMGKQTMVTCPVDQGFTQKIDQLPAYLGIMFHRRAEVPSRLAPLKPTANCFRGSEREANLSRKC